LTVSRELVSNRTWDDVLRKIALSDKETANLLNKRERTMSDITRRHTNQRMSQSVVHGNTVYLAGQVGQNTGGQSVAAQTQDILDTIDSLLAEAGSDKSKILSATIWLCSMDDFAEMNAVWDAWVPEGNAPCRACVESPRLATPAFTVEIGVIAAA